MTKLEIDIKNKIPRIIVKKLKGAYLATFSDKNDRIIFFNDSQKHVSLIERLSTGDFNIQNNQSASNYTELQKIKKITLKVELA